MFKFPRLPYRKPHQRPVRTSRFRPQFEPLENRDLLAVNILFFGNSFTNNGRVDTAIANLVTKLAVADGLQAPNVVERVVPGSTLSDHVSRESAQTIASYLPAEAASWDYVVIQGQSLEAASAFGQVDSFRFSAVQLFQMTQASSPNVHAVLYETWARQPGDATSNFFPVPYANAAAMQQDINAGYAAALADLRALVPASHARLAPAGPAWQNDGFNNLWFPFIQQVGTHANQRGALLAAMTIFSTIYETPVSTIPIQNAAPLILPGILSNNDWIELSAASDKTIGQQQANRIESFVAAAYQQVLHRTPDNSGGTYWIQRLEAGSCTRSQFSQALVSSDEHHRFQVGFIYQDVLGRVPDAGGLDFFTVALNRGLSEQQLTAILLGSAEYRQNQGNDNAAVVQGYYQIALHRAPGPSEQTYWVGQLNGGSAATNVAMSIVDSNESLTLQFDALYQSTLGRGIDPGATAFWIAAYRQGTATSDSLWNALLGSNEYYGRF